MRHGLQRFDTGLQTAIPQLDGDAIAGGQLPDRADQLTLRASQQREPPLQQVGRREGLQQSPLLVHMSSQ